MSEKPTYEELQARVQYLKEKVSGILSESEKKFRKLIEDIDSISIQGYDEERRVIFWNHASEKIYGWTEQEAMGQKLEDLIIPPPMKEAVKEFHHRWVHFNEKIPSGELVLVDKAGNDVPVLSSHVMYESPQGKEMFCIDVDLTFIRQAEREKEKLSAQLQQARKMEAVGTLAGGIAHDFNNILQVVNSYVEILLYDRSKDDPDLPNLFAIATAAKRGAHLIRQLLLFSRKAETLKKELNINLEIKLGKDFLERIIPRMIEIKMNLSEDLWTIHGDAMQISQIILNIGSNAADAMPDGGTITIETSNVSLNLNNIASQMDNAARDYVLLSISNTGEAMEKETMEKIFEPFFTTKETGKGTGLGLASVYGIVKNHGGYISCRSEQVKGTVFDIYLPTSKQKERRPTTTREEANPKGGEETVLVVDDDENVRNAACTVLKRFGYRPLAASNGEEALAIHAEKAHKIDLVILDISMPKMGGHKCLQGLLTLNPSIRVLMSSGYSADDSVSRCLKSGAMGYIGKPYMLKELLQKTREVLDR